MPAMIITEKPIETAQKINPNNSRSSRSTLPHAREGDPGVGPALHDMQMTEKGEGGPRGGREGAGGLQMASRPLQYGAQDGGGEEKGEWGGDTPSPLQQLLQQEQV